MNGNANLNAAARLDDVTATRWSLVQRLHASQPGGAGDALAELALHYWYPVYAYVRRSGHAPEIAQDIVRSFFQYVGGMLRSREAPPRGRFRAWLLATLNTFLATDWRDPVADDVPAVAPALEELEQRNRIDHPDGSSPEQAYQRGFALEMLARGFARLRAEARQTGHLDMYEALEPWLTRDPGPGGYEELGRQLGMRPLVLVVALKRLRQRFRELVRDELADTVTSADEMAAEQQALFDAFGAGD